MAAQTNLSIYTAEAMNDDRISEVYKGEIWTDQAQERARRRIHWMIGEAAGEKVLDIGCSQGISSILLGREGFHVVGIDIQESRIEYALNDLKSESEKTRERVDFRVGEGSDLDFEDESFDTVLLGEVLEHLAAPEKVLTEARRVVRTGGRVVITTPFGLLHHHDHKQTFFTYDLLDLVSAHLGVIEGDIMDGYFRLVAEKGVRTTDGVREHLHTSSLAATRRIQDELTSTKVRANRLSAEVEKLTKSLERTRSKLRASSKETGKLARLLSDAHAKEKAQGKELAEAEKTASELAKLEEDYIALSDELQRLVRRTRDDALALKDLNTTRSKLLRQERELVKLRYRVEIRDWKLSSLRERRWWRLGKALGEIRQKPWKLLSFPGRLFRLLVEDPVPLPRPEKPAGLRSVPDDQEGSQSEIQGPVAQHVSIPIVPRRDIPVIAFAEAQLRERLSHEVLVFPGRHDELLDQLDLLAPWFLIIDTAEAARLAASDLLDPLKKESNTRTSLVLWDNQPQLIDSNVKLDFDVVVGRIEPPSDNFQGRFIELTGCVQTRTENPIGTHRRPRDAAEIDLVEMTVGGELYSSLGELLEAAKEHKVLHVLGAPTDEHLQSLAATSTPLITTDENRDHGLFAESAEEVQALESSLLRSEVLRARLSHPRMREAMRFHSITPVLTDVFNDKTLNRWPQIDVMVATKRPTHLDAIFENLARQTYPNLRVLLVDHGHVMDHAKVQHVADAAGVDLMGICPVDESVVLGEVFNIGFANTEASIVAKMDDDDFYGAEYLWDLYQALDFSGAEVAGKWAHYVYLEGLDSMIYRFKDYEHRYTDVVAISTLLMRREVLDVERFPEMPWGSGSVFLRALGEHGARVFAADRWNYIYIRGQDGERNTYPITDMRLLSNSDVVCRGLNLEEVIL